MNTYSFRKDLLAVQEELLRFAYKLTADREEANDLLQETSLKALDNEDKFEPDTNFRGWMYTIMRNIFINNYRKIVRVQPCWDFHHTEGLPAQKLLRLFQRVQNNPFQLSTEQYVPTGLPGVDTYRTTATCPGKQD